MHFDQLSAMQRASQTRNSGAQGVHLALSSVSAGLGRRRDSHSSAPPIAVRTCHSTTRRAPRTCHVRKTWLPQPLAGPAAGLGRRLRLYNTISRPPQQTPLRHGCTQATALALKSDTSLAGPLCHSSNGHDEHRPALLRASLGCSASTRSCRFDCSFMRLQLVSRSSPASPQQIVTRKRTTVDKLQ